MSDYTAIAAKLCPRLKALRESAGLDKKEVAERLGYGLSNYGSYETKILPSIERLVDLAQFFDVSTDYLLGLTDDPAGGRP